MSLQNDTVTCSLCGLPRPRGVAHRCAAPGLLTLTAAAQRVLAACRAAGGQPLIVGGSVRDAMASRRSGDDVVPKDIDIEVYRIDGTTKLKTELSKIGRVDQVGVSFGVLKVRVGSEDFDVSLPRRDSKTASGHRGFDVQTDSGLDEVEAFARRDYTINAMGWDPGTDQLVDPWGGSADLAAGVLRHTTDAFSEDPLRVLRGMQMAARLELSIAPETAELAAGISDQYAGIALERVWGEFAKLASKGVKPSLGLNALHQMGWERNFPELAAVRDVPQDVRWHPEGAVHVHLGLAADAAAAIATRDGLNEEERQVLVLAAMLHDLGKAGDGTQTNQQWDNGDTKITSHGHAELGVEPARSLLRRIGAPRDIENQVLPLIREHMCSAGTAEHGPTKTAVRRLIRRLSATPGGPDLAAWARLLEADASGRAAGNKQSGGGKWLAVAETLGGTSARKSILTGRHLIQQGMKPGPVFSRILDAAVAAQDDGAFQDENGALAWLAAQG